MANVERHDFFPTCLYRFKHEFKKNELENMIKHIDTHSLSEHNGQTIKRTGSQTQDELHKIKTFSNLTKTIIDINKYVLDTQGYMGEIEITNMWGNILSPKSRRAHAPHTHSNNIFSGVFYLKTSSETAPIQFFDPRPNVLSPTCIENTIDNVSAFDFNAVKGTGVIFPSWMQHWVPTTSDTRISISWNIILRGHYGGHLNLQNAKI